VLVLFVQVRYDIIIKKTKGEEKLSVHLLV